MRRNSNPYAREEADQRYRELVGNIVEGVVFNVLDRGELSLEKLVSDVRSVLRGSRKTFEEFSRQVRTAAAANPAELRRAEHTLRDLQNYF